MGQNRIGGIDVRHPRGYVLFGQPGKIMQSLFIYLIRDSNSEHTPVAGAFAIGIFITAHPFHANYLFYLPDYADAQSATTFNKSIPQFPTRIRLLIINNNYRSCILITIK